MKSTPTLGQRTRILARTLAWWISGSEAGQQKLVQALAPSSANKDTEELKALNEDEPIFVPSWEAVVPNGCTGDGRWWLLTHNDGGANDMRRMGQARVALAVAYFRTAPSKSVARWALDQVPAPGVYDRSAHQRLLWGLKAALEWEQQPSPSVPPASLNSLGTNEKIWCAHWAALVGQEEIVRSLAATLSWKTLATEPASAPGLWWWTVFDKTALLETALDNDAPVNHGIAHPEKLINASKDVAEGWRKPLLKLPGGNPRTATGEPDTGHVTPICTKWQWDGFNAAMWAVSADSSAALDVLVKNGVPLNQTSKGQDNVLTQCVKYGTLDCMPLLLEGGAVLDPKGDKDAEVFRKIISGIAEWEKALIQAKHLPNYKSVCELYYDRILPALGKAMHVQGVAKLTNTWGGGMIDIIDANTPALAQTFLKLPNAPKWNTLYITQTHNKDGKSTKTKRSFMHAVVWAGQKPQGVELVKAFAGQGVDLLEPFDPANDMKTCAGIAIASMCPWALDAWLEAATPAQRTTLAQSRAVDGVFVGEGESKRTFWHENESIWNAALRSKDTRAALQALSKYPEFQGQEPVDVYIYALKVARKGAPEKLSAVVDSLSPASWKATDTLPSLSEALTRPFDERVIQKMVSTWSMDVNIDKDANTPLHWALQQQDGKLVEWLLQGGAPTDRVNKAGITPREMAHQVGMGQYFTQGEAALLSEKVALVVNKAPPSGRRL